MEAKSQSSPPGSKRTEHQKAHQRDQDRTDRAYPYRIWRRKQPDPEGFYTTDIDQIEWRRVGNKLRAVAVLEITRHDGESLNVTDNYLDAILRRYRSQGQSRLSQIVAAKLGCKVWIVLFNHPDLHYWVYNLSDKRGWWSLSERSYYQWLKTLQPKQEEEQVDE